jgi:hypothetical protein
MYHLQINLKISSTFVIEMIMLTLNAGMSSSVLLGRRVVRL